MTPLLSTCANLAKFTVHYDSANELRAKITECIQVTILLQQFFDQNAFDLHQIENLN